MSEYRASYRFIASGIVERARIDAETAGRVKLRSYKGGVER